jgi:hypothetical protein
MTAVSARKTHGIVSAVIDRRYKQTKSLPDIPGLVA